MEQLGYNLLFRWFLGCRWMPCVGRDGVHQEPRAADRGRHCQQVHGGRVEPRAGQNPALGPTISRWDGTLIEAWASMKSFRPKDGSGDAARAGPQWRAGFSRRAAPQRDTRLNHGPDASAVPQGPGQPAKLPIWACSDGEPACSGGRQRVLTLATGTAEREAALELVGDRPGNHRITLGADKAYDVALSLSPIAGLNVTRHVAQNTTNRDRQSMGDDPPSRLRGQWTGVRKRIGECVGWTKAASGFRKTHHAVWPASAGCSPDCHCLQSRPAAEVGGVGGVAAPGLCPGAAKPPKSTAVVCFGTRFSTTKGRAARHNRTNSSANSGFFPLAC